MNTAATPTVAPEVRDFLTAVRAQLADLDPEEQREILDGLEADLTDLVAERGRGALGDPVAYARELRTAAGLEPDTGARRVHRNVSERIHVVLDAGGDRWRQLLAAAPGDADEFLTVLRPVWWVLRAWLAVETVALALGVWALTIIPGSDVAGVAAIVAAAVLSIQLGRGRIWPAERWRRVASLRVLLLGLNVLAVAMVPVVLNGLQHGRNQALDAAYHESAIAAPVDGLRLDGEPVRNVYPYDAHGHPLVGVQLLDSSGRPLSVDPGIGEDAPEGEDVLRLFPWHNGRIDLFNVFPLVEQRFDWDSGKALGDPALQPPPYASLPPASRDGVTPSAIEVPRR